MKRESPPIGSGSADTSFFLKFVARSIVLFAAIALLLFLTAGRIDYWQGWLFIGILAVLLVVALLRLSERMDLARERFKPGRGIKWWDKLFMALYFPLSLSVLAIGGLDAGRFGWTHGLPIWVYPVSVVIYVASFAFTRWAMTTNQWFSSVVRIQTDRDQRVVRDGPYRFIRHPGYAGFIACFVSVPFILGSLWALIPAGVVSLLLIVRTTLEDATLKKELAGYAEYAGAVKYRLLPGVW